MTCRLVVMRALTAVLFFGPLAVFSAEHVSAVDTPTVRLLAPPLPRTLEHAFRVSFNALNAADNPVAKKGIGFQIAPAPHHGVTVLVAEQLSDSHFRLPFLCSVKPASKLTFVELCDYQGDCNPIAPSTAPVLLCNLGTFFRLAVLTASLYSPAVLTDFMRTDDGYMKLAKIINRNPQLLIDEYGVRPLTDRNFAHLFPLTLLVLAHEFDHIRKGVTAGHWRGDASLGVGRGGLLADTLCRNYLLFEKTGYYLGGTLGDLKLESIIAVVLDGYEKDVSERAVAIWRSEREADLYAARVLQMSVERQLANGIPATQAIVDFTFTSIQHMAFYLWYQRLGRFVETHCSDCAESRFIVNRCMCKDPEKYDAIAGLFESTHPPIYLRLALVLRELSRNLDFGRLEPIQRSRLRAQWTLFQNLMEIPFKMVLGGCLRQNFPSLSGTSLVFKYPALEGFFDGDRHPDFLGAPPDSEWNEILLDCLPPLRTLQGERPRTTGDNEGGGETD